MNAKTALELGAPIRGILAFTSTSTFGFHWLQMTFGSLIYFSLVTKQAVLFLLLEEGR